MSEDQERSLASILGIQSEWTPAHDILQRFVGVWSVEGDWYLFPGRVENILGRIENVGILGDHFIESITYSKDIEQSRVIYGYDSEDEQFIAFAINAISNRCDLEHGQPEGDNENVLRFSCVEYVGKQRIPVLFERRVEFLSADAYDMTITYPEREPSERLGMDMRIRRIGAANE